MKNTIYLSTIWLLVCSLQACLNYEEEFVLSPEWYRIDLSNPVPGQTSYYVVYEGCSTFELTGDTLILSVFEKEGVLFLRERFSKMSPIRKTSTGNRKVEYPFYSVKNHLYLPERRSSFLFWFYENDFIELQPKEAIPMSQERCAVKVGDEIFTGNEIGFIERFEAGPFQVKDQYVVSCEPNYLFSYLFYDERELQMSHYISASGRKGYRLVNADLPEENNYLQRSSNN